MSFLLSYIVFSLFNCIYSHQNGDFLYVPRNVGANFVNAK